MVLALLRTRSPVRGESVNESLCNCANHCCALGEFSPAQAFLPGDRAS
jgi:hypothetical protein